MLLFCIILLACSISVSAADKYYKGEADMLLKKGDKLWMDDLSLRIRNIDHITKTAILDFEVNDNRVESVMLGKDDEYNFQDKLTINIIDVYRRSSYNNKRTYYARIEFKQKGTGRISNIDFGKFGKNPFVFIENDGFKKENYLVEFATEQKSLKIKPMSTFVEVDPFESKKVSFELGRNTWQADKLIVTLKKDGKTLDKMTFRVAK